MGHLAGKAAVVTGAGRGIGRAVALLLAREGARVIVNDPGVGRGGETTDEAPADQVVAEIHAMGGEARPNYASVVDYAGCGEMVEQCVAAFGKVDILVNSAGILRAKMIWDMTEEDFDTIIAVHLKGHWNMCHHAIRHMRKAGYGRIVNLASNAFKGSLGQCNYSAAKGGIISLTRSIAKEAAPFGITANAICPAADTRMTMTPYVQANWKRKLDAGLITQAEYERTTRPRSPDCVAPMIAYLCTEGAYYINGMAFNVERGLIHTYYFGEERRAVRKEGDGMFTIDELAEVVPTSLMSDVVPIVPPVQVADAKKAPSP